MVNGSLPVHSGNCVGVGGAGVGVGAFGASVAVGGVVARRTLVGGRARHRHGRERRVAWRCRSGRAQPRGWKILPSARLASIAAGTVTYNTHDNNINGTMAMMSQAVRRTLRGARLRTVRPRSARRVANAAAPPDAAGDHATGRFMG